MFRSLALFLCFILPLWSARNYTQTDTDETSCTTSVLETCASGTNNAATNSEGRIIDETGSAGSSEIGGTMSDGDSDEYNYWFLSDDVSDTSWAAGDWVIRLNVTTADTMSISDLTVCRVNSSCTTHEERIAGGPLTPIDLNSTGTKTITISGSAATAASGDLFLVVVTTQEDQAHGNSSVKITPSLIIDTPLTSLADDTITIFVAENTGSIPSGAHLSAQQRTINDVLGVLE